ncbi:MAG: hypothetical protein IAE63_05970 [Alphaproteobacteria bacterium]|jgi:hypothetical protein|nr:hypothetical protein [Alphaproteobacteria bacterium]
MARVNDLKVMSAVFSLCAAFGLGGCSDAPDTRVLITDPDNNDVVYLIQRFQNEHLLELDRCVPASEGYNCETEKNPLGVFSKLIEGDYVGKISLDTLEGRTNLPLKERFKIAEFVSFPEMGGNGNFVRRLEGVQPLSGTSDYNRAVVGLYDSYLVFRQHGVLIDMQPGM